MAGEEYYSEIAPPPAGSVIHTDPYTGRPVWGNNYGVQNADGTIDSSQSAAEQDRARYQHMGAEAYGMGSPTLQRSDATTQMGSLALLEGAARGTAPSQAALLAQQQGEESVQAGASLAASSRGGPGAQIAAARAAQQSAGRARQQALQAGAMARAKEMSDARGQFAGAASQARGQDIQESATQADLDMRQRGLNSQDRQFYERMAWDTRNAELGARTAGENAWQAQQNADRQFKAAQDQAGWDRATQVVGMGTGAATGGLNAYANVKAADRDNGGLPKRAEGGPVNAGQPYVVGERGPEVVVPSKDGTVIPNHQLGAYTAGVDAGAAKAGDWSVMAVGNPDADGMRLRYDDRGRGTYVHEVTAPPIVPQRFVAMQEHAAASGGSNAAPAAKAKAAPKAAKGSARKMTDDELARWADAELAKYQGENARLDAGGYVPAVAPALIQSRGGR